MAATKHSISLREDLSMYVQNIAHEYFQDNISMFVGYLVSCYMKGKLFDSFNENSMQEEKQQFIKDPEVSGIIDDIDSFFGEN
jgi:hypothetical protein